MKRTIVVLTLLTICAAGPAVGQGFDSDPVFKVRLVPDRTPLVAGDELRLAVKTGDACKTIPAPPP